MKRKTLWKMFGTGALALSLIVSPLAGTVAQAAENPPTETTTENPDVKEGDSKKALDPTQDVEIPAKGNEGDTDYKPAKPAYADVEIPVWGYTEDATVYSVDVEWGAMTFQWENSSWDPETHMKKEGAGWKVYDSANNKALDATEDKINEIKVTNHSNAQVWATLAYKSEAAYDPDTTGAFGYDTGIAEDEADSAALKAKLTAATTDVPAYLTLETADNATNEGEAGTPTVAKAYFMPDGLAADLKKGDGIAKWTKIGTITVGIKTAQPTAAATPSTP